MQQKCHGQYPGVFVYVLLCMHTLYAYVCIQCTNMYVRAYTLAPAYRHMFNAHPLAQLMRWTWSGHGGGWILSFVRFWSPPSPFLHSLSQGRPLELTNWIKYTWCLLPTPFESSPARLWCFCWVSAPWTAPTITATGCLPSLKRDILVIIWVCRMLAITRASVCGSYIRRYVCECVGG